MEILISILSHVSRETWFLLISYLGEFSIISSCSGSIMHFFEFSTWRMTSIPSVAMGIIFIICIYIYVWKLNVKIKYMWTNIEILRKSLRNFNLRSYGYYAKYGCFTHTYYLFHIVVERTFRRFIYLYSSTVRYLKLSILSLFSLNYVITLSIRSVTYRTRRKSPNCWSSKTNRHLDEVKILHSNLSKHRVSIFTVLFYLLWTVRSQSRRFYRG